MNEANRGLKMATVFGVLDTHYIGLENGKATYELKRSELINLCIDALIEAGVDKHDIKPNLVPAYYQMHRVEKQKGSRYVHHKYKKKAASAESSEEADSPTEASIPEDAQWMVKVGETVEYFRTRKEGQAFAKANDIMVKEVTKIETEAAAS